MKKIIFLIAVFSVIVCVLAGCADTDGYADPSSDKSGLYGYTELMTDQNINPDVYTGVLWRIDNEVRDSDVPRTFRTVFSELLTDNLKEGMDESFVPSQDGMTDVKMSGSAQFDEYQIDGIVSEIRRYHSGDICIVDLRQESHLFVNGMSLSWYGLRDWGNAGRDLSAVNAEEEKLADGIIGRTIDIYYLDDDKQPCDQELITAEEIKTEKETVEEYGLEYYRLPCTDHVAPSDGEIDEFTEFIRNLDDDTWLHFHCEAGKGRTTLFMAMYDMMMNPDVSLDDIAYRQCEAGGNYILKDAGDDWRDPYYNEKAETMRLFYQYVQDNYDTGFEKSYSNWKAENA